MNNDIAYGYINGRFAAVDKLTVPVMDRGFLFGDGCYEVIPVYFKKPFRMKEHKDRLISNLAKIGLDAFDYQEMDSVLAKLIADTAHDFQYLYLQVTRGSYSKRDHLYPVAVKPTFFSWILSFEPPEFDKVKEGVRVITAEDIRWDRCDIKSISLLGNVMLRQLSHEKSAKETLLFRNGNLTEGSTSNVFIVKSGKIYTPVADNRILPGITRAVIIELARNLGLSCEECPISLAFFNEADEIWISSSTKEVLPVSHVNDKATGFCHDNSLWKKIFQAFQAARSSM